MYSTASLGLPGSSVVKNPPAMQETGVQFLGLGRYPGGKHDNPLQYSCLENPTDREAWPATVHGVTKSRTRLKRLSTHTCDPGKTVKVDTVPAFMEKA